MFLRGIRTGCGVMKRTATKQKYAVTATVSQVKNHGRLRFLRFQCIIPGSYYVPGVSTHAIDYRYHQDAHLEQDI